MTQSRLSAGLFCLRRSGELIVPVSGHVPSPDDLASSVPPHCRPKTFELVWLCDSLCQSLIMDFGSIVGTTGYERQRS